MYQTASSVAHPQVLVQPLSGQVSMYDHSSTREDVVRLIVGAKLPISFDENPFFEQFVKSFIPNYQCFSRHTIRGDILRFFHKKKTRITN